MKIPFARHATGLALAMWAAGCTATDSPGAGNEGPIDWSSYTFVSDDGHRIDAQLGRLKVPLHHGREADDRLEIAFVRLPTTSTDPGTPIVYLAGGPGGSGIELAKGGRFPLFQSLRSLGDVIALDQRGAGLSEPNLGCPGDFEIATDAHRTRELLVEVFSKASRECAAYWRKRGMDLDAFNTNEIADDIDRLREALGVKQLRIVGMSYGSHLGLDVLRRHGDRVERAVLAGVEGPDHTLKSPAAVQTHLEEISEVIRNSPAGERLPDLEETLAAVIAELESEPVLIEANTIFGSPIAVSAFDVKVIAATLLSRREGIAAIPSLFGPLQQSRDYKALSSLIPRFFHEFDMSAMGQSVDCASGASEERRRLVEKEARTGPLSSVVNFVFPDVCVAWEVRDLGPEFRANVESDVPTLFISGGWDINTPVRNAVEVRRNFANSAHLIVGRAGHEDALLVGSQEIMDTILGFLSGSESFDEKHIDLPPVPLGGRADDDG